MSRNIIDKYCENCKRATKHLSTCTRMLCLCCKKTVYVRTESVHKANNSQLPEEKRVKGIEARRTTSKRLSGVASRPVEPLVDTSSSNLNNTKDEESKIREALVTKPLSKFDKEILINKRKELQE